MITRVIEGLKADVDRFSARVTQLLRAGRDQDDLEVLMVKADLTRAHDALERELGEHRRQLVVGGIKRWA